VCLDSHAKVPVAVMQDGTEAHSQEWLCRAGKERSTGLKTGRYNGAGSDAGATVGTLPPRRPELRLPLQKREPSCHTPLQKLVDKFFRINKLVRASFWHQ